MTPDRLSATRHWQLDQNVTATDYPDQSSIADLFSRQAGRTPDAIAVHDAGRTVTYRELETWSNRLAAHLVAAGVERGEPVAILGERCLEAPVAMLAILKAGCPYVPLDRSDPLARLRWLTDELAIRWVVTLPGAAGLLDRIPAFAVSEFRSGPAVARPSVPVRGTAAAYVMFTSGSTGTPKAVAVAHRSIARLVVRPNYLTIRPDDRVANGGHLAFDASVFEVWGALLNGATLVVVDPDTLLDPSRLEALLGRERVSIAWLSAGVFHNCAIARPGMFGGMRHLLSGGDVLIPELVRAVLLAGPPGALHNGYGPTENTTFSTTYRIRDVPADMARIPIGRPISNSTCYVVRPDGTLCDPGEEGEILVGGEGVALGYLNTVERTAARFTPDPHGRRPGARLFRTGDRGRWLPSGDVDFLGRNDRMIKMRDFRIELDEVEAQLGTHPALAMVAVTVAGNDPATRSMVAFYTPHADTRNPGSIALREYLAQRLPAFMLPGRYVRLERFPLTGSGKIDRLTLERGAEALTTLTVSGVTSRGARRPPTTPVQIGLAKLWSEFLDVNEVSLDDSFFELGGNSLLAARVFARLQGTFGLTPQTGRFLTRRLLADPSLEACAEAVVQARSSVMREDGGDDAIDLRHEATLGVPIRRPSGAVGPDDILLTGATGFLGCYLLRELQDRTDRRIWCLVRAVDAEQATHRLCASAHRYELPEPRADRVTAIAGDLARPLLGLDADRFDEYAHRIGLVMHCGAYVNFTYPYQHLAGVTVNGTRELVRLAGRHRGAPVHFVSTIAVLAGFGAAGVPAVTEQTPLAHGDELYMGYPETKWVAETLLRNAAAAGLPVAIHRPYEISGGLAHGAWNLESATCAMFRMIVDIGAAPDIPLPLELVPVDLLARQIVHIALSKPDTSATYHLTNPRPGMLSDMVDRLRAHGYPVRAVPLEQWVRDAVRYACDQPEHPFAPFIPLWVDRAPRSGLLVKQMYCTPPFPSFGTENADAALADSGIKLPPVDADLLDHYIRYLQRVFFLPAPPGG